jgi:hypothetical protein
MNEWKLDQIRASLIMNEWKLDQIRASLVMSSGKNRSEPALSCPVAKTLKPKLGTNQERWHIQHTPVITNEKVRKETDAEPKEVPQQVPRQ